MPGTSEDQILVAYLRRSYHAVDGLWFVMVEDETDFDRALALDNRVWAVMGKIQARKARELLDAPGNSPEELARCFALKLTADGHAFERAVEGDVVRFTVDECPWLALLRKSGRAHLAAAVSQTICPTEGRAWAAEFGGYAFELPEMACTGAARCEMRFVRQPAVYSSAVLK